LKRFRHLSLHQFKINFILFWLCAILIGTRNLFAITPVIQVTDTLKHPIPYVTVHNLSNQTWLVTDENGKFFLSAKFNPGDTLELHRIGYLRSDFVIPVNNKDIPITLPFDPVTLNSVTIAGKRDLVASQPPRFAELEVTPQLGLAENQQLFQTVPGVYFKSYGGPAGLSSISLDGAPASHTNITYAGFDLTNAQNGQVDISQIPTPLIRTIIYSPLIDSDNPEIGGSEGVIAINPGWSNSGISLSTGSYGHYAMTGNLDYQLHKVHSNIILGKRHDNGNYPVRNPITNQQIIRSNNAFDQRFLNSTLTTCLSTRIFLKLLYLISDQERGIAGLVWSPTLQSQRADRIQILGTKLGWTQRFGFGSAQLLFRQSNEHYLDPTKSIDSRHTNQTYQLMAKQQVQLTADLTSLFYLDLKYDYINSTATGIHRRLSSRSVASLNYQFLRYFSLFPTVTFNYSPDNYANADYNLRLQLQGLQKQDYFYLETGKFYRFPSFNDLYWQPGGNPDLLPENTRKISFGGRILLLRELTLNSVVYYKQSQNLILWMPLQSYWQPKNIRQAIRNGLKLILTWQSSRLPIFMTGHYDYNYSEDQTPGDYYGKALRYAPQNMASFLLSWQPARFSLSYQINHTGRRIAGYDWPEDIYLKAYTEMSLSASYTFMNHYGKYVLIGAIQNLTDTRYETLLGYPEPGRSFRLTLQYKYH
jgi:vitamin B12 transporter